MPVISTSKCELRSLLLVHPINTPTFVGLSSRSFAIGDSPIRAVMRTCVKTLVEQEQFWQPRGRFQVPRWRLKRGPRADRDTALRTAGFISLLHLLNLGTDTSGSAGIASA